MPRARSVINSKGKIQFKVERSVSESRISLRAPSSLEPRHKKKRALGTAELRYVRTSHGYRELVDRQYLDQANQETIGAR